MVNPFDQFDTAEGGNPPPDGFVVNRGSKGPRAAPDVWPGKPDLQDAPWIKRGNAPPAGYAIDQTPPFDPDEFLKAKASAPPFDPSKPYVPVDHNPFDKFDAKSAPTLADAPWAKYPRADGIFDDLIPKGAAKSAARQWAKEVTAPPPTRPQGYGNTLESYYNEAEQQLRHGVSELGESTDPTKSFHNPLRTAGAISDIAGGVYHGAIAPATAAFRNYVSGPLERLSYEHLPVGVRAENIEQATLTGLGGGAGARTPAGSPLAVPRAPVAPEVLAARTAPERGSALSIPGTLARQGPVDLEALEREISTPAGAGAAGTSPELPEAVPRENLSIRLLQPNVPHDLAPRGRASVGAAGTEADPLSDYSPQTIQRARELLTDSGLDNPYRLEQVLDEVSPHHTFGELTPALEKEVSGIHAADKGQAKNLISQTFLERAREAPQRMASAFDRAFGRPQNTAELTRDIEAERAKTTTPLWRQFTNTPVAPTPELRALLPRLDASGALKAANKAMREEGLNPQQGFARVTTDEAGEWAEQVEHMPTAAAFQYAKEHLDSLIERSLAEPGGAKAARRYTQLKNDLVNAVDRHPDPNVAGVWQAARQAWQQPTELLEAQKIGRKLLTGNVDREDVPFLTAGWSPERLDHLNIGIRGYLEDLEKSNRNSARASNKLLDAVLQPGNRDKLRSVLGDERAGQLIDAISHEEALHGAPSRIIGGSPTAERQAARDRYTAEGQGAVGKSLSKIAGFVRHPVRSTAAEGVEAVAKRISTKQEAAAAQLRDELARIMTTQGAERNALARALIGADEPPASTWARPGGIVPPQAPGAAAAAPARAQPQWSAGGWRPVSAEQAAQAAAARQGAPSPAARQAAVAPEAKSQSLLEFLASKGGLQRNADLAGILGNNKFLGRHGWVFRENGLTEDKARELAAEAGYLANEGRGGGPNRGGGTSTIRDLHEALNDEARGRRRYPIGEERIAAVDPDEQRHHVESAVLGHFEQQDAPVPDSNLRDRVVQLVRDHGMNPDDAHERAVMESYHHARQDEGLPSLPARATVGLSYESDAAQKAGVQAQAARQSQGAGTGQASRVSGQDHPKGPQSGYGPVVERVKQESAVRLAHQLGLTARIQHLAMAGKSDAEIARAIGEKLPEHDVRRVRHHLGIGAISELMGEDDIPFARGGRLIRRAAGGRVNPDNIDHNPTEAQKRAGNYAKDHVSIHGLDITIENAKGKKREGVGRDGKKWSVTMPAHYGYIKRTTGHDGDHVDVYLGPHIKSPQVYVVDQHDADSRKFDEHKAFIGFGSAAQVRHTYRKGFSDGRGNERLRHLTEMSIDGFKHWLANGDTTKPLKRAAGGRAEGGDVSDDDAALAASMTHQPEGPNPAQPYLDAARKAAVKGLGFATGGLKGAGVDVLPDWMNTVGAIFQNPDNQPAIGGGVGSGRVVGMVGLGQKFTDERLKELAGQGMNFTEIGKQLGVTRSAASIRAKALGIESPQSKFSATKPTPSSASSGWYVDENGVLARQTGRAKDIGQPLASTVLSRDASGRASGGRIPGELTEANKHSHAEVGYVSPSPRAKQRCELCTKFITASEGGPACKKVVQPIAALGWCKRFVRKSD